MAACYGRSTFSSLRQIIKILQPHFCYSCNVPLFQHFNRQTLRTSAVVHHRLLASSSHPHNTARYSDESYSESDDDHSHELLSNLRHKHRQSAGHQHSVKDGVQFSDFAIDPQLALQLTRLGYDEPFEIQAKTLPHTLAGRDVIGRAVTGSGKTLAFSIPIIQKISESEIRKHSKSPKAIVISPTRELCQQIYRSIQELHPRIRCVALYGGDSYLRQESAMRRGIDVVCATPGRLNDHLQRGNLDLKELTFLCLDEADELLTPNFKMQIQDVLDSSPEGRQVMLFSATMPPDIVHLTKRYMNDPVYVDIAGSQKLVAPDSVKHMAIKCNPATYTQVIKGLIHEHQPERCILFMETKVKTTHTAMVLRRMGLRADALNSDLTQRKREQILSAFRLGKLNILVATDVAARGLDIPEVDLVIQVGPPRNGVDFYIHRSGRTGRAGRDGLAVTLHDGSYEDRGMMQQIQRLVKLEHVSPPNQDQLDAHLIKGILRNIENVRETDRDKYLEQVDKLDLTDNRGRELLASAIAVIMRLKTGESEVSMGRHGGRDSGSHYRHGSYGHEFSKAHVGGFSRPNHGGGFRSQHKHSGSRSASFGGIYDELD